MPRSKQQIRATRAKERKFVEVLVESGGDAALALKSAGYTTKYPADLKRRILERPGVREYFDTLMAAQGKAQLAESRSARQAFDERFAGVEITQQILAKELLAVILDPTRDPEVQRRAVAALEHFKPEPKAEVNPAQRLGEMGIRGTPGV